MYKDRKPLTKSEKIKLTIFMGCILILLQIVRSSTYSDEVITEYKTPAFSELQTSTGIVSFTLSPRNGSNKLVLTVNNKDTKPMKINFVCDLPGLQKVDNCNNITKNNEVVNIKKYVVGKQATVWWTYIKATGERRIYQLESGGVIYIKYEEQAKIYSDYVQKKTNKN